MYVDSVHFVLLLSELLVFATFIDLNLMSCISCLKMQKLLEHEISLYVVLLISYVIDIDIATVPNMFYSKIG